MKNKRGNKRPNNKHTPYAVEQDGVLVGNYATYNRALEFAQALTGYRVIRRNDEKVWES